MEGRPEPPLNFAVFCSDAADTYQLAVISSLTRDARLQGHRLVIFVTNVLPEFENRLYIENQFLDLAGATIFDGAIVLMDAVCHRAPEETIRSSLLPLGGLPWVSIGKMGGHHPMVVIENSTAFRELLGHLHGHHRYRDFLFLLGPETSSDGRERSETIREFLSTEGRDVQAEFRVGNFRQDVAQEQVLEFLDGRQNRPPQVIVACNDGMALGALAALRERGLRCPQDCAVTGFDDVEVAALEFPSLTTVRQPLANLASHVLVSLRDLCRGDIFAVRSETTVPTLLTLRESCGCTPEVKDAEAYRWELSRVQNLRIQEQTLLHHGSSFSLEINSALDLQSVVSGLDRFCRSLVRGSLRVALFETRDVESVAWPTTLRQVYFHDGNAGDQREVPVTLASLFHFDGPDPEKAQLPLVFLLHNQGRRIGVLSVCYPASWSSFFKLMAANLSTGLSRVDLLSQLQVHSQRLEGAVVQRTIELTEAVEALRAEIEHRKALESELEKEQQTLQAILETQPLPLVILTREANTIRFFNHPFAVLTGYDDRGLAPSAEALTSTYGAVLASLQSGEWDGPYRELRLPLAGSGFRQVMVQKAEILLRGEPCLMVGMIDLSRQKQLEQDLLNISENERERFGQELHDDVCQQLAALSLYTTVLGQKIETRLGERLGEVQELSSLIDGILDHVRSLSRGLFPIEVGQQSLDRVFEQFLTRIEAQTKLTCQFASNMNHSPLGLAASDELHLFRILQEAVQNTLKYAQARTIRVSLMVSSAMLTFQYEDDGIGISAPIREGVGLRSMRYRASQLGTNIAVTRGPEGGVCLALNLILAPRERTPS